ncbi:group 1 truncated hemoglobin [Nocardia sp. NPDC057227]|uniref:group I truncated hemoglobin n=1 Tax=Nocardia sp. NPDC057227 TaxID=3346056 RepID=UPI003626AE51
MDSAAGNERRAQDAGSGAVFDRIGGREVLEAVVADFYTRVLADDQLSGFFSGVNMKRLRGRQVEFFAAALGGPEPYIGAPMREVHQGRGITATHFGLVTGHLAEALRSARVPEGLVQQILGVVEPLAEDITSGIGGEPTTLR